MAEALVDDPLVKDLLAPGNLPPPSGKVEFRSTHASFVFLTEDSAYKVKRAKDYGFFDYRSLEARKHYCEEEVRLNRRGAGDVYRGVLPVYRDQAGFSLTRPGEVVDWAVHMRRLPEERTALSLLRAGRLGHDQLAVIARAVSDFYARVEQTRADPLLFERNVRENFEEVEPFVGRFLDRELFRETRERAMGWLAASRERLERRPARDGHGDLRLEHVYLLDQEVLLLDCIEFLDRFRIADPALDAAFLAMDLLHHQRGDLAEEFLGRFALERDDYDFYPLAGGYLSYRAWVRGKVACLVASDPQGDPRTAARKRDEAARYFALARRVLDPPAGRTLLIGVGGIIGTGKSTLAEGLARRLSIPVLSADATRKWLAGVPHEVRGDERIYRSAFTRRVREEVLRRAGVVLDSGRSVLVDTTFASRELRARARREALERGAGFRFIECRVPAEVARERLRRRTGGVSDAREDLYGRLAGGFQAVTEIDPGEHLLADTTRPIETLVTELAARLREGG